MINFLLYAIAATSGETRLDYFSEIKDWYCLQTPIRFSFVNCEDVLSRETIKQNLVKKDMKIAKSDFCRSQTDKSNNADVRCLKYNSSHPPAKDIDNSTISPSPTPPPSTPVAVSGDGRHRKRHQNLSWCISRRYIRLRLNAACIGASDICFNECIRRNTKVRATPHFCVCHMHASELVLIHELYGFC